jgi:HK97 family phage portal protein
MKNVSVFTAIANALTVRAPVGVSLQGLNPTTSSGFWPVVRESFTGAWQRNVELRRDVVLANWAVYSCLTLIAGDIGKLALKLRAWNKTAKIWEDAQSAAFSPVLRKPNRYQTRQQFIQSWVVSKLAHGNTYVLKERDLSGVVRALYVLDPCRCRPMVAPDGSVYYALGTDWLNNVEGEGLPAVPASEVIHDRMECLFHPLQGVSPLFASGLAATQGLRIQQNSAAFFANFSQPGGILSGPDRISDEAAARIKKYWDENYGGANAGKVAVLGDGLTYSGLAVNAVDSEMTSQLKLTGEMVCSTFHVPAFKVGMGAIPAGQKVGDLNQIYYSDCLQQHLEAIEVLLDEGLGLVGLKEGVQYATEFDTDDLLRMDPVSLSTVVDLKIKGGYMSPDEARQRSNMAPVPGGDTPYMQQQNFSLAALAKRDAREDPFGTAKPPPPPPAPAPAPEPKEEVDDDAKAFALELLTRLAEAEHVG